MHRLHQPDISANDHHCFIITIIVTIIIIIIIIIVITKLYTYYTQKAIILTPAVIHAPNHYIDVSSGEIAARNEQPIF